MRVDREAAVEGTRCSDDPGAITGGVLAALAYADVFGWPLTADEIHRTLPVPATRQQVLDVLHPSVAPAAITAVDDLYVLWGATDRVAERRRRTVVSAELWRQSMRCGGVIARLPFVRMVAVSGSLAVG